MPTINLGTCCGSNPTLGVPAWLKAGGVGIDTAFDYKDQPAIAQQLAGVPRASVFLTTKVPAGLGAKHARQSGQKDIDCVLDPQRALDVVKQDIAQLQVPAVDLVLLHAPCEEGGGLDAAAANAAQWHGLQMALDQGLTRAIGVSNYNATHLDNLQAAATTKTVPAVNQCQMSIAQHDDATIQYCLEHKITYEAWRIFGDGGCPFADAKLGAISKAHGMTPAQVCLRWALQRGAVIAVGTGSNTSKVDNESKENLAALNGTDLTAEDMAYLNNFHRSVAVLV